MKETKAVSYAVRFRASDLYFSISNMNYPASAVQICKIRLEFFDLRIRRPKSSDFGPKSDRPGSSDFQIENDMLSKFKMLSTTANSSRTVDEVDGDTAV